MILRYIVLLSLFVFHPVFAAEGQASNKSVRELLSVTQVRKTLDTVMEQYDAMMHASMKQALGDTPLTPEQQKIIDGMRTKTIALFKKEMKWEVMEPIYIKIYTQSFTQQEIDGMLVFYKSPAGQAVISKMPTVMQNTMQAMQSHMSGMMPKLQQIMRDTIAQARQAKNR